MEPTSADAISMEEMFQRMKRQEEHMRRQEELMAQLLEQKEQEDANIKETFAKLGEQQEQQKAQQEIINRFQNQRLDAIEQQSTEIWEKVKVEGGSAVGKIVVKIGIRHFAFHITRIFSVKAAKTASKTAAKAVPILGIIIGTTACVYRYHKGEGLKAVGEMASGLLGVLPIIGAILAPSLDAIMGCHDMYECHKALKAPQTIVNQEMSLEEAYKTLLITSKNPTQEEVDCAYRRLTADFDSDHIKQGKKEKDSSTRENCDGLMTLLSASKDLIYKERGW